MEIFALHQNQHPEKLGSLGGLPDNGYLWVDLEHEESSGWAEIPKQLLGVTVLEQHRSDSQTPNHRSFFDGTAAYDQVIFQGLAPDDRENLLDASTSAFYLFDRLLISIHVRGSTAFKRIKDRLQHADHRVPDSAFGLLHQLLDTMVNRFLTVRAPLAEQLEKLQDELLDADNPYSDWKSLLGQRKEARWLEHMGTNQSEAISEWRDGTWLELTDSQRARLTDLLEHVDRILHHARSLQSDIETAVQLHFSAVAHRTNEIVRVLTILSAIFLPLTLIAGIFGMNFEYMPELKVHYAYYYTLGGMAVLALISLAILRIRRWL